MWLKTKSNYHFNCEKNVYKKIFKVIHVIGNCSISHEMNIKKSSEVQSYDSTKQ